MDVNAFHDWLLQRGRSQITADEYRKDVVAALAHPNGVFGRLREKLAPKTIRRIVASLRAWCKFTKDTTLLAQLEDFRLPPADRVTVKVPLAKEDWSALLDEINRADYITEPERAILGLIAVRGMRVGDALRIKRADALRAMSTNMLIVEVKLGKRLEFAAQRLKPYLQLLLDAGENWNEASELIGRRKGKGGKFDSASMAISRALKACGSKVGIPKNELHCHRLRRTYAVFFLEQVKDIEKLRQHCGWSNIATAASYADHDQREKLEDVANKMFEELDNEEDEV